MASENKRHGKVPVQVPLVDLGEEAALSESPKPTTSTSEGLDLWEEVEIMRSKLQADTDTNDIQGDNSDKTPSMGHLVADDDEQEDQEQFFFPARGVSSGSRSPERVSSSDKSIWRRRSP